MMLYVAIFSVAFLIGVGCAYLRFRSKLNQVSEDWLKRYNYPKEGDHE